MVLLYDLKQKLTVYLYIVIYYGLKKKHKIANQEYFFLIG